MQRTRVLLSTFNIFTFMDNHPIFTDAVEDGKAKQTPKKAAIAGLTDEVADEMEQSGAPLKISEAQSEKVLLAEFSDLAAVSFSRLLSGYDARYQIKDMVNLYKEERRKLRKAGKIAGAIILAGTVREVLDTCRGELELSKIQKARAKIITKYKEERLKAELEERLKEKTPAIETLAKSFGISFETAKALYLAGKLNA